MPKLGHRAIDIMNAIQILMDLYESDPEFRKDRDEIRKTYGAMLQELVSCLGNKLLYYSISPEGEELFN